MDLGLKDKVAIIGGASKGLGRACAQVLAEEGAKVAICSRTSVDQCPGVVERAAEVVVSGRRQRDSVRVTQFEGVGVGVAKPAALPGHQFLVDHQSIAAHDGACDQGEPARRKVQRERAERRHF